MRMGLTVRVNGFAILIWYQAGYRWLQHERQ